MTEPKTDPLVLVVEAYQDARERYAAALQVDGRDQHRRMGTPCEDRYVFRVVTECSAK